MLTAAPATLTAVTAAVTSVPATVVPITSAGATVAALGPVAALATLPCPAIVPAGPGGRPGGTPRGAAAEVLSGRFALDHFDRDERQLAAVVDLPYLHLDLVTDLDHVIDILDPDTAVQLADLGDVQQAILARQQRNECAEGGRLHHCSEEPLANLGDVRVRDRVDRRPGSFGGRAVGRADVDRAVVLDGDLCAGVFLDRVDHLA